MTKNILCLVLVLLTIFLSACASPASGPATTNSNTPESAKQRASAPAPVALPPTAYSVQWIGHQLPTEMNAGEEGRATVTLKNTGNVAWPSKGTDGTFINQVSIAYHWLPPTGDKAVIYDGVRTSLTHNIVPDEIYTADDVRIIAPTEPGSYRLQLSLVHEGVVWFEGQGAKTLIVPVEVH